MKISIIGTGYVGLVTGACFADAGFSVTCMDIDVQRIKALKLGEVPFYEPQLKEIIASSIAAKKLKFTTSYREITKNNIIFICVGTPDDGSGKTDMTALNSVVSSLKKNISNNSIIFVKSTVPMGTNKGLRQSFHSLNQKDNFKIEIVSNPEFLKEGDAVNDFKKPDRIIVGTKSANAKKIAKKLYEPYNWQKDRLVFMSPESAELTKYAANSMLAMRVTFMNELSRLCDLSDANIHEVRSGIGSDSRIGSNFLYAGLGYGGSCFPKDVQSLISIFAHNKVQSNLIASIDIANQSQLEYFYKKIQLHFKEGMKNKSMTIWGLSFKPNTDDLRESVGVKLVHKLAKDMKTLYLYDPMVSIEDLDELKQYKNVQFLQSKYEAISSSHALLLCTEWKEFWQPDFAILSSLKDSIIFDGRNIYNQKDLKKYNIKHVGIGT